MNFPERMRRATTFVHAPCIDTDVDMVPESPGLAGPGLALCRRCPVVTECRADFVKQQATDHKMFGIWGAVYIPPPGRKAGPTRRPALEEVGAA